MGNLRAGRVIYSIENDHHLIYHGDDDHIVAWSQNYYDGQPLNTWRSCDYGIPEEAARTLPGLRTKIEDASKKK